MIKVIKWIRNAIFGEWHTCHCYHCDDKGNYCDRLDCHPGQCRTPEGERF